jgi:ribosomal RNA-processing protein 17
MAMPTNTDVLTQGHRTYALKKHKRENRPQEILFDEQSRRYLTLVRHLLRFLYPREYLTGFHKRKTERQKKAQEHAKDMERKQRLEMRKKVQINSFILSTDLGMEDQRGKKTGIRKKNCRS